jgi:tRNA (guanine-N7-)-methyltransferase
MICKRSLANKDIPQKRVYGRRQGRPLNASRTDVIQTLLPALSVPIDTIKEDGSIDPATLFDKPYDELWFEVGFGAGEHLSALMRRHPDHAFIGAEPFINGMASFLKDIKDDSHHNIALHMDDAMMLARSLPDACLGGMYVLNPDPWHKKRHHKRRIISKDNLDVFARILKPGKPLIMTSDVLDLADWMVTRATQHPQFEWTATCADDWRAPPKDWITTAYEVKGAKGAKVMSYLFFERV